MASKKSNDHKKLDFESICFAKKSLQRTKKQSDNDEMCSELKMLKDILRPDDKKSSNRIQSILLKHSIKDNIEKPVQIFKHEFDVVVGVVKNLKTWIVFALRRIFSGGKPNQSLLKISLDELNGYEDWFQRIENLTACIKSKNYAGALEILSKCLEYSENLTVIGSNNEKKSAKFLSDLLIFCTGGLQVISSFSVNKNLSRKKLKLSTPNFYCRSATNLVKASKHKTFCCKR